MNLKQQQAVDKIKDGYRLTINDAQELFTLQGTDLYQLLSLAQQRQSELNQDRITYVRNYNLNLSNMCINNCRFCGFHHQISEQSAYCLSLEDIEHHLAKVEEYELNEICLVSGLHPDFTLDTYLDIIEKIKSKLPDIHIHGITPAELAHGLRNTDLDFKTGYKLLKEAGLGSVPGTAAEILVPAVRKKICPNKITTKDWIKAIKSAHRVGLKSTATILYGHVETIPQRIEHLKIIRDIQDQTNGFTEFIPLSFIPYNTQLGKSGEVNSETTGREDLLMIAISRLFLDNISNIQASWVKYGPKLAQIMLTAGANDLGGTLFNENITKAAGKDTSQFLTTEEMIDLIEDIGYVAQERTTLYELL